MLPSSGLMNGASPQKFLGLYLASLALTEQEELVIQERSTLGALGCWLLSGLVNHNKLNFSSIFCNNRIILWCRMGHLINWQLRHQRDHIKVNFGMEILVPDSDF